VESGIRVEAQTARPFFAQRAVKTGKEIRFLQKSQDFAQQAIGVAMQAIRAAKVDSRGRLVWEGKPLTSESVQSKISVFLAANGFDPSSPIVSCGAQAAFPHERGHGPLFAHKPIIIDVFPRNLATRYWGDVTRTVVKDEPSKELVKMYGAVKKAQELALEKVKEGATGDEIHKTVQESFKRSGFDNKTTNEGAFGFTHGTGHGVGLDIHEEPRLSTGGAKLSAGNVVTVEPGLYYPKVGGVRIEDMVVVEKNGERNLTRLGKELLVL
jgi:Xaa-Pro aminopeptidase